MVTNAFITTGTQILQPYPITKLSLLKPSNNPLPALKDPPQRTGGTSDQPGEAVAFAEPRTKPRGPSRASERQARGSEDCAAGRLRRLPTRGW